jgi:hypothetical protein
MLPHRAGLFINEIFVSVIKLLENKNQNLKYTVFNSNSQSYLYVKVWPYIRTEYL